MVADAFCPFGGFQPGTRPEQRRLELTTAGFGGGPADEAIELAAACGWALYELPARHTLRDLGPGPGQITVDTANRLQGREFDLVIVLHPLSGRRDATAFHLEAGRLCVLTSRHRHAPLAGASPVASTQGKRGLSEWPGPASFRLASAHGKSVI